MQALADNWFFIALILVCIGMHMFGHGHGHKESANNQTHGDKGNHRDKAG